MLNEEIKNWQWFRKYVWDFFSLVVDSITIMRFNMTYYNILFRQNIFMYKQRCLFNFKMGEIENFQCQSNLCLNYSTYKIFNWFLSTPIQKQISIIMFNIIRNKKIVLNFETLLIKFQILEIMFSLLCLDPTSIDCQNVLYISLNWMSLWVLIYTKSIYLDLKAKCSISL